MVKLFSHLGFVMAIILIMSNSICAFSSEYDRGNARGWHWYDASKPSQDDPESEEERSKDAQDAVSQMNAIRATVNRALNEAVLNPTQETVGRYITLQNQVNHHAEKFEKQWKAILLQQPALDYSLKHPTNNIAKQVENNQQTLNENAVIQELAKKSGLFFFYRSSCPYCVRFAPIVKDFAETYGITVIPITTDGISLPEFPNSHPNSGQAEKFHVTAEPALFAVNPYTKKAFPISYGLISESDLKKRILDIATHFGGFVK